jgi:hypothetical protein
LIEPFDLDQLVAGAVAAHDRDAGRRDVETLAQQATQGPVRTSVECGGCYAHEQRALTDPDELITASASLDAD